MKINSSQQDGKELDFPLDMWLNGIVIIYLIYLVFLDFFLWRVCLIALTRNSATEYSS